MRITIFILLATIFQTFANETYSQRTRLNLDFNETILSGVLDAIENQTEFYFLFNEKLIDTGRKVSISARDEKIEEILQELFAGTDVVFTITDRKITLTPGFLAENQQQQRSVSGKVTGGDGETLPGVTVIVKGTNIGTITNSDGAYNFSNVPPDAVLVSSFVGMKTQEVAVSGKKSVDVVMESEAFNIDEVVAIGYGTVKKSDLTGSVSSLRRDEMNKGVTSTITSLLQGKAAGVQITQASTEPGGGTTIQIRGAGSVNAGSDPLYVIDGLPIETSQVISGSGTTIPGVRVPRSPISNINPADIESVEILKDASATAIYGARGANGVILVTTKKGSSGAMKIHYSGYAGFQMPVNMIEVLNAGDYMRILNEILDTPGSNVAEAERVTEIQDGGTNWQNELLRNAMINSHSLSFSGGNSNTKYFASLNYFNQDGVLITSAYDRYDSRLNLEHRMEKLLFGINFSTSYIFDNVVPVGFSTNEEGSSLYAARGYDPTLSVFDEDGNYNIVSWMNLDNPLALVYGKTSETQNYRTLGTVFGGYTILKG